MWVLWLQEELELLVTDGDSGKAHFSLKVCPHFLVTILSLETAGIVCKGILAQEKNSKKKKKRKQANVKVKRTWARASLHLCTLILWKRLVAARDGRVSN